MFQDITNPFDVFSGFGLTRGLQQVGSGLTVSTSRDHVMYEVDFIRDELDGVLDVLGGIAFEHSFKPWEVSDMSKVLKQDLETYQLEPNAVVRLGTSSSTYRILPNKRTGC